MEIAEDFLELSQSVPSAMKTSTVHLVITAQNFCWAFFNMLSKAYPLCPGGPYHWPDYGITWELGNQEQINT